jgi:hypothetical protein
MENDPFSSVDPADLDRLAQQHGFKRKGRRNWVRRTSDFIQLVNLQHSQWSSEQRYLNFALWPLSMGEPPSFAESKFHFRTRAERMGAVDLPSFFACADGLNTLRELHAADVAGRISGLMTKELRASLPQS